MHGEFSKRQTSGRRNLSLVQSLQPDSEDAKDQPRSAVLFSHFFLIKIVNQRSLQGFRFLIVISAAANVVVLEQINSRCYRLKARLVFRPKR